MALENCPARPVLVIDNRKDARAASAGDILIIRLIVCGGAGIVSDGGFRNTAAIGALEIPAHHSRPASPTNPTLHEAIDIDVPIGCGAVAVFPGDAVADAAPEMTEYEAFVVERVKAGESIIGLYPRTKDEPLTASWAPRPQWGGVCLTSCGAWAGPLG